MYSANHFFFVGQSECKWGLLQQKSHLQKTTVSQLWYVSVSFVRWYDLSMFCDGLLIKNKLCCLTFPIVTVSDITSNSFVSQHTYIYICIFYTCICITIVTGVMSQLHPQLLHFDLSLVLPVVHCLPYHPQALSEAEVSSAQRKIRVGVAGCGQVAIVYYCLGTLNEYTDRCSTYIRIYLIIYIYIHKHMI